MEYQVVFESENILFVKLNEPLINRFFTSNLLNLFANASSTLIMLLVKADILC